MPLCHAVLCLPMPLPCLPAVMTVATLAQEASACVTQPGCGYLLDPASGPAGLVCTIGTYSSGNNQQPCVTCPAGLTTSAARQESVASCMAPAGYFFQVCAQLCIAAQHCCRKSTVKQQCDPSTVCLHAHSPPSAADVAMLHARPCCAGPAQAMQALPCPKGAYKTGIDRAAACTPCAPAGITTAGVASASIAACDRATPGYRPVRSPAGDTILGVEPCPFGTFGPDGLQCITCADNLTTQATARTSPADCLAAPGFGYYKDGQGDNQPISTADLQAAESKVVKCPSGSYKVRT